MMKKNPNLLNDPHLKAIYLLAPTVANPTPRYAWDLNTVMPSDLIVRTEMPSLSPLGMVDEAWLKRHIE